MDTLTDREFACFQQFIFKAAGIHLPAGKKVLVAGRLAKRVKAREAPNFGAYYELLQRPGEEDEAQTAVDLLTTNETYFFREPKHFELLRKLALEAASGVRPFRVWSAASSTGEEAFSTAMVLADCLGERPWEVVGTDISSRVVKAARTGLFPMQRASNMPPAYLKRFCLKGHGEHANSLLVVRELRQRVSFRMANLNEPLPSLGEFDLVFLRNVMIYFNQQTKRDVVRRVIEPLRKGGYLCIGHSESLSDLDMPLEQVGVSVYRKPV